VALYYREIFIDGGIIQMGCLKCSSPTNRTLCDDCVIELDNLSDCISLIKDLYIKIEQLEKENKELNSDSQMLLALEVCGVDNWSGYDDAMQYLEDGGLDE
jgi:hypothetical protein